MNNDKKGILRAWVLVIQLGLVAVTPVALCIVLAVVIKNRTGADYMLVLALLGIVSGAVAAYKMAAREAGDNDETTRLLVELSEKKNRGELEEPEIEDDDEYFRRKLAELNERREQ